ncbi:ion transporter [Solimonas sp. K1W22B-7]|uniref:ion transporter n=1 Tax=Solimonas sp. K1W22B-7 TaxID=2303331 RepID=UPI000E32E63B|nr:ion transporter [Solimonas sp. K1W22B-7]AXQ28899.1 ion transporter [Solimonas sp. K1W22B-7]
MTQDSELPTPLQVARRIRPTDWIMLVLALLSIGLLSWETWGSVTEVQRQWILRTDYLICGLFATEFLWRWREEGWRRGYLGRNWYEILGMIPISSPALRGFRLFRVIRILILLGRFGIAADRALGDEFTYRLVNRFKKAIVDSISGAITVAVLNEVAEVLARGTYTENISRALEENQKELRAMILEKLREDKQTGRLRRLPFYDDIVESVIDAAMRVIEEVLKDPRTDELVADLLRENLTQLRAAIEQKEREGHSA